MAIEFNNEFYVQSKFNQLESEGLLEQFELTDVASLAQFFEDNGVDAREHYLAFGMAEGINPSAEFDTNAYLEAKLADLQNADKFGDEYADFTVQDVIEAFQASGLTALEHFNEFGEAEGLSATPVAGETSGLTEALSTLASAEAGVTASLAAAAETVNAQDGDDALEGDELETFVEQFDADQLEAAITAAEDAIADAEADLNTAQAAVLSSRAETFDGDVADAFEDDLSTQADSIVDASDADFTGAVDSKGKDVSGQEFDLGIKGGDRLTDANLAAAVNEAQKAVNADKTQYLADGSLAGDADLTDGEIDTFTAKGLQTVAINAESALNADVSANGTNVDLLTNLRAAIADLAEAGEDISDASTFDADAVTTETTGTLIELLGEVNDLLDGVAEGETTSPAAEAFIQKFYDESAGSGDGASVLADIDTGNTAADKAFNDVVADIEQRDQFITSSATADDAFEASVTGGLLTAAEALQEARDNQEDAVIKAEQELEDAQGDLDALNAAQDDYDAAVTDLEEAQQYFEDNDLEQPVAIEGGVTATAENDIFLYTEEEGTVSGFGLEGEDQIFVGSGYAWTPLEAGANLGQARLGDAGVLEIFAQQVGNNVVLSFEEEAFAGNALNLDDIVQVTLTGVSLDSLNLSDDGFITVA